jgi:hypothetical protein
MLNGNLFASDEPPQLDHALNPSGLWYRKFDVFLS